MKNSFGTSVIVTLFGESHGPHIGAVLDGMAPGIKIDEEYIKIRMAARAARSDISTSRKEPDEVIFASGVKDGVTTGTPICLLIQNTNTRSGDYQKTEELARPGHADYTAQCKYHGFQDKSGGGHFSGRITAALTAAGAICELALEQKGIYIGTHISKCAGVADREFDNIIDDIKAIPSKPFPVLDDNVAEKIREKILDAKSKLDSVGGVLETAVTGIEPGVGEPWFDTVESQLSHALFAIPAIKGVEFGAGFAVADMMGSEDNDSPENENGKIIHTTNNAGGINGGITNGMPIIFRCAVKPTPSIAQAQQTINMITGENSEIEIHGRHDPAIVHRAAPVVSAMTAIVICDMLAQRYGTDYLKA